MMHMQWNIHVATSQNNLDHHFITSTTEEKVIYLPWLDKEEQKSLLINKERQVMKSIHYNRLTDNLKKLLFISFWKLQFLRPIHN